MNHANRSLIALALAAVLFVAVNVLAQNTLRNARLDLTAEGLHTLSPGSLGVIGAIREPVSLTLYVSETLADAVPALRTYGQRVRELLEAYAARSDGRIRLRVIDPEPFSDAEDRAVEAGVQALPFDRGTGRPFYLGLVGTNSTDRQETIPFLDPQREVFLEHDLTKLVHALSEPKKPVVGILTDMPLEFGAGGLMEAMRGDAKPYAVYQQLRALFEVRTLQPSLTEVDPDVSVLVVARPKALPDDALHAIDQYVLKGGKALLFVDPWAESDMDQRASKTASLPRLFDAWGLTMDPGRFVADPRLAISAGTGRRTVPYPAWLALGDAERDRRDVVTAELGTINVATAGSLGVREGAGITLTPLLTSSPAGQLAEVALVAGRPEPEKLLASLSPQGSVQVIAARVGGRVKTAFPDRPGLKESTAPANLIVVADTDLLEDRFWVETQRAADASALVPFAGNGDFVVNAVENLSGSADLIALRGRAGSARPFTVVEDLRRAAGQQVLAHEQDLRRQLEDTERRIAEIQGKARAGSGALIPAEEQAAVDRFRAEVARIRKELRAVQHTLNRDIEELAATVKAVNIVAMPLVVAVGAVGLAGWRSRRRARRVRD